MHEEEVWSVARGATIGLMLMAIMFRVLWPFGPVCYNQAQLWFNLLFTSFVLVVMGAQALVRERKRLGRTFKEQLHDAWLHGFDFVSFGVFSFLLARPLVQHFLTAVCR